MKPELNLTNDEKQKIMLWKQSLPDGERKFMYSFVENGELYDYIISTDDGYFLSVSKGVEF